jgi:hypothetical protein
VLPLVQIRIDRVARHIGEIGWVKLSSRLQSRAIFIVGITMSVSELGVLLRVQLVRVGPPENSLDRMHLIRGAYPVSRQ